MNPTLPRSPRPFILAVASLASFRSIGAAAPTETKPVITKGLVAAKLHERGAHLVEAFDGEEVDTKQWRRWISDEDRTKMYVKGGRYHVEGRGRLGHNGLWQLGPAKYKDVCLVACMDIRSDGAAPHQCLLHLCGGDMPRSPDHWVEIAMVDQGDRARFSVLAAVPEGVYKRGGKSFTLPRGKDDGFLAKLELNGATNLCSTSVWDGQAWRAVVDPVELLLRTTHCEVKIRGGGTTADEGTKSVAWFDDVRIYPRPETHPVLFRLAMREGTNVWRREGGRWPPTIQVAGQPERNIDDLTVELRTADGETLVSSVRSRNMGHYMLSLKDAPWHVYPVAARVRLLLDGEVLGQEVEIPLDGLEGMYPDDVWDLVLE